MMVLFVHPCYTRECFTIGAYDNFDHNPSATQDVSAKMLDSSVLPSVHVITVPKMKIASFVLDLLHYHHNPAISFK